MYALNKQQFKALFTSLILNTTFLLESLNFHKYFFFLFSCRGKVHWMCHLCDPIYFDRGLYSWAAFAPHAHKSLQNNPYSFSFILTSGGAAEALAIKHLIYLIWKQMISKDSWSGDNKSLRKPKKTELDWSLRSNKWPCHWVE